jgi:hypothetical protein
LRADRGWPGDAWAKRFVADVRRTMTAYREILAQGRPTSCDGHLNTRVLLDNGSMRVAR